MNRDARDDDLENGEAEPILASRSSSEPAAEKLLGPADRAARRLPAKKRGLKVLMVLCALSLLALVGFAVLQFSQTLEVSHKPAGSEAVDESKHAHGDAPSPSSPASSPASSPVSIPASIPASNAASTAASTPTPVAQAPGADDVARPPGSIAPADQFDLRRLSVALTAPTTREYVFNVTRGEGAPDGVRKTMLLVNGQSPGPLIEANAGDTIRVVVNNMMPDEKTTIHWHGIDQRNSTWMDGVVGLTQCGTPPGERFTYTFAVPDQRGTFWYHAHVSVQYTDGLFGPLVIHDPDEKVPTVDEDKVIMVGDLYHEYGETLLTQYLGPHPPWSSKMPGMEPPPDNIVINGRHIFNCTVASDQTACDGGSLYSTRIRSGHRVRLRLISHSTGMPYIFTVDNHTLEIVEIDGVEVEPIVTTRVFMNPGQRYSVLIAANQTAGNYRMRATAARSCFHLMRAPSLASVDYEATGILSYDDVATDAEPLGQPWDRTSRTNPAFGDEPWAGMCHDLPFDLPKPVRQMDAYEVGARNLHYLKFKGQRGGAGYRFDVNDTIFAPMADEAALWRVPQQDLSVQNVDSAVAKWDFGPNQQVLVSRDADKAAQIVINSKHMMFHPWHLHGQNFQVVGWGNGAFGGGSTTWNLKNPMRRDTVAIPSHSHVVIRFMADNPGVWALHCHILWHAEGGMFVSVAQQLGELKGMIEGLDGSEGSKGIRQKFCSAPA